MSGYQQIHPNGCLLTKCRDLIPEPSHNVEVNKIEYIGNYLGEWISQNNTEVIEDVEGSVIEDTDDDKKGHMEITLNEQNEPQVYIWMMSRISRTFEGTF